MIFRKIDNLGLIEMGEPAIEFDRVQKAGEFLGNLRTTFKEELIAQGIIRQIEKREE